jgi:hypothetical protein
VGQATAAVQVAIDKHQAHKEETKE